MKKILVLFINIIISTNILAQWLIPNEYFGKGQYWETDAYNYQNYPYTIFSHANGTSITDQKNNLINLINIDRNKPPASASKKSVTLTHACGVCL